MSTAEEQWVLERRAHALARRTRAREAAALDVVVFTLARETYAMELAYLRQVFPLLELALLPGAEPPLLGVTAWRGELIRVLDLTRVLDVEQGGPTDRGRVLVLGGERGGFAMLADSILDMTAIVETTLTTVGERRFVRGVTADAITVLDGGELIRTYA